MKKDIVDMLETPCIVIDMEQTKKNIARMQKLAGDAGCTLRPHIKTHKMPLFAKMQLAAGAKGITCAKVSEAEVMANSGIRDIFIAYPMVGKFRLKRVLELHRKIERLILAVDSIETAQMLNDAAVGANTIVEVRLEVDTGAKRTGVLKEKATELASEIARMPGLRLTGIYTFKSLIYQGQPTTDPMIAGREEGELMEAIAKDISAKGIELKDISAGSTPTGIAVANTGKVNEIRPGTYIFNDYMVCMEKAARIEDIAVRLYATVVSTPSEEYAVIDGGTKTFPMDIELDKPPYYYPGYAIVVGREDLRLTRMNEEHGILISTEGKHGLQVGQVLELIPIHVCTAINMQNFVYVYDGEKVKQEVVEGRGMLV